MQMKEIPNTIGLRTTIGADYEFVYQVKKAALGVYIDQIWGWDEDFQRDYHRKEFIPSKIQIITFNAKDVGWQVVNRTPDWIYIVDIVILPEFQRKGIGSELIRRIMCEAKDKHIPVRLGVFKINPVRSLYERLGFSVFHETETHYEMEAFA